VEADPDQQRSILYQNLKDFAFVGKAHANSSTTLDAFDEMDPVFVVPSGGNLHIQRTISVQGRRSSVQGRRSSVRRSSVLSTHATGGRRLSRRPTLDILPEPVQEAIQVVAEKVKNSEMAELYEKAKVKGQNFQRKPWVQKVFEYGIYTILILFVYFVLVGRPLWNGAVWWLWWVVQNKFVISGGFSITVGLAAL
ncbi:hypothetical protein LTS18_001126, partial [Coniosporium uncinatum]